MQRRASLHQLVSGLFDVSNLIQSETKAKQALEANNVRKARQRALGQPPWSTLLWST